jgi:hypothetical protein
MLSIAGERDRNDGRHHPDDANCFVGGGRNVDPVGPDVSYGSKADMTP